jgi:hypothetical protein
MPFRQVFAGKEHVEPLRCHSPIVSYDEIGFSLKIER